MSSRKPSDDPKTLAERDRATEILRAEWEYWAEAFLTDQSGGVSLPDSGNRALHKSFDLATIIATGAISNALISIYCGESVESVRQAIKLRAPPELPRNLKRRKQAATSARAGAQKSNLTDEAQRRRKGAGDSKLDNQAGEKLPAPGAAGHGERPAIWTWGLMFAVWVSVFCVLIFGL